MPSLCSSDIPQCPHLPIRHGGGQWLNVIVYTSYFQWISMNIHMYIYIYIQRTHTFILSGKLIHFQCFFRNQMITADSEWQRKCRWKLLYLREEKRNAEILAKGNFLQRCSVAETLSVWSSAEVFWNPRLLWLWPSAPLGWVHRLPPQTKSLVLKPGTGTFGSVCRCQVLLENEISIPIKLVSRRKCEELWSPTPADDTAPQPSLKFKQLGNSSYWLWDLDFQIKCNIYFNLKRGLWATVQSVLPLMVSLVQE